MERKMLWTAEAVEVLKNLALAGRSASVIAATLGAASRNAVIGKANRIGIRLNGDGRASTSDRPARGGRGSFPAHTRAPNRKAAWAFAEAEVQEMRRVGFEDIHEFVCRWPLGDPMSEDFVYCGLKAATGHSYCAGHCRLAYQPPKARARRGRRGWRWS
jgi:GcrA cell cycle regulator